MKEERKDYLSVEEVAEKFEISRQTVYNRLKKEWSGYGRKIGGKTCVSAEVLPEDVPEVRETEVAAPSDTPEPPKTEESPWREVVAELRDIIADQKAEIERLRGENTELEKLLKSRGDYIEDLSRRFADLAEQSHELTRNAQTLHAIEAARTEAEAPARKIFPWRKKRE